MIPKIRPTIGDSKPRTIDKIPKISEVFFFYCEFILQNLLKININDDTIKC